MSSLNRIRVMNAIKMCCKWYTRWISKDYSECYADDEEFRRFTGMFDPYGKNCPGKICFDVYCLFTDGRKYDRDFPCVVFSLSFKDEDLEPYFRPNLRRDQKIDLLFSLRRTKKAQLRGSRLEITDLIHGTSLLGAAKDAMGRGVEHVKLTDPTFASYFSSAWREEVERSRKA